MQRYKKIVIFCIFICIYQKKAVLLSSLLEKELNRNASEAIFRLKSGGLEDFSKSVIWFVSESAERAAG